MNRAHIDALLRAGLITLDQHQAAIASIDFDGRVTVQPQLDFRLAADEITHNPQARTITGIVSVYEHYIPSHGLILHTGSLKPRTPYNRVKLLRDHNHSDPLGYMTEFNPDTLEATFYLPEGENGDRALEEAANGLRDGMSVGWTTLTYEFDDDWTLHVYDTDFYETSLCALPAIPDAGVINVAAALATLRKENRTMNRAQLAAALAAGTITQDEHDAALATLDKFEATTRPPAAPSTQAAPPEVTAGPTLMYQQPAPVSTHERPLSLEQVTRRMVEAASTGSIGAFTLAISDVLPADDAGDAWTRPEWLNEVFTSTDETRTWINAIGQAELMNALDGKGWRWDDEPEVDEYDMDNTEVASNDISTEPVTYSGFGFAAAWGVARSLIDFANEEFTRAFWERVGAKYQTKSNAGIRTRVLAACRAPGAITAGAGGSASVATGNAVALVKQLVRDVRAISGGKANRVFLGATQFGLLEDLGTDNLPLWLKSAEITLDITEATAELAKGKLLIAHDATLGANQGVAFDSRAFRVKEKKIPNLSAIAVSHGKVDLGLYGYMRLDTHDPRLAVKRTAGEVLPT